MEMDQIFKQVDWLDEERRKEKIKIGSLEERVAALEGNFTPLARQVIDLDGETTRLNTLFGRVEGVDVVLLQNRLDNKQQFEAQDKENKKRQEEADKVLRAEMRALENALTEMRKETDQLAEIKRNLRARVEEETRLSRVIDEVRNKVDTIRREKEEDTRIIKLMDDGRRQDSKRVTDLTGEVTALRKRHDDQSNRLELSSASVKKLEIRLNELAAVETERREAVSSLVNDQALRDVERERIWKEWQARFHLIETQATDIETTLQNMDTMQRSIKQAQQTVEELSQKLERRINEITEIQRLTEERFRQEWTTFKADDQKRWTNYTLTSEEQHNETQRLHEKLAERLTYQEDTTQEIQDLIQQMNELTEKRLQTLLTSVHEWVASYERTVGRGR